MSKPGWVQGVVENEIEMSLSLLTPPPDPRHPTAPKARKKKEQPAPTSKPGGGDIKQCGTPQHPSALASAEVVAVAGVMPASTPLRGMEQAERAGGCDPAEDSPGSSLGHLIQGQPAASVSRKGGDPLS